MASRKSRKVESKSRSPGFGREDQDKLELANHIGALNFPQTDYYGKPWFDPTHDISPPTDHCLGYLREAMIGMGFQSMPELDLDERDRDPITVFSRGQGGPLFLVCFCWYDIFNTAALLRAARILSEKGMALTIVIQHSIQNISWYGIEDLTKCAEAMGLFKRCTGCIYLTDTGGQPKILWIPEDFRFSYGIYHTERMGCSNPDFSANVAGPCLKKLRRAIDELGHVQDNIEGASLRSLDIKVSAAKGYPEFVISGSYDFWRQGSSTIGDELKKVMDRVRLHLEEGDAWDYVQGGSEEKEPSLNEVEVFIEEIEGRTGWKVGRADRWGGWELLWRACPRTLALGVRQGSSFKDVLQLSDDYVKIALTLDEMKEIL